MADEESEIRRMAEIADAINEILDADPVGDTPSTTPSETPAPAIEAEAPAAPMDEPQPEINVDLDAAIAAELNSDEADAHGHFGPVPVMDFDGESPRNNEIGRDVKSGSHLADLSLRMQDTLAEIRSGQMADANGQGDVIGLMQAAREEMMVEVRAKVAQLTADTQKRKQALLEQVEQIEQDNMMFRDELNVMLLQYEEQLKNLQTQYFESAVSDRDRLDRYREFLQYLLSERGL